MFYELDLYCSQIFCSAPCLSEKLNKLYSTNIKHIIIYMHLLNILILNSSLVPGGGVGMFWAVWDGTFE